MGDVYGFGMIGFTGIKIVTSIAEEQYYYLGFVPLMNIEDG